MAVYGINGEEKFKQFMNHFSSRPNANFAEIGVYNGGVVKRMATLFPHSKIYAYDTFEGLPKEYFSAGEGFIPGTFFPEKGIIEELKKHSNIIPIKGLFPESYDNNLKFWTIHLDVDYYESTKVSLESLFPNMISGSSIFIDDLDDPCCFGIRKIHDELNVINKNEWAKKLKSSSDYRVYESTKNQLAIEFI